MAWTIYWGPNHILTLTAKIIYNIDNFCLKILIDGKMDPWMDC